MYRCPKCKEKFEVPFNELAEAHEPLEPIPCPHCDEESKAYEYLAVNMDMPWNIQQSTYYCPECKTTMKQDANFDWLQFQGEGGAKESTGFFCMVCFLRWFKENVPLVMMEKVE